MREKHTDIFKEIKSHFIPCRVFGIKSPDVIQPCGFDLRLQSLENIHSSFRDIDITHPTKIYEFSREAGIQIVEEWRKRMYFSDYYIPKYIGRTKFPGAHPKAMRIQHFLLMELIADHVYYRQPWSLTPFLFIHLKRDYLIKLKGSYSRALVIYTIFLYVYV